MFAINFNFNIFLFQGVIGHLFVPVAWLMGVSPAHTVDVAKLIGIKTVVNEFVGYKELGILKTANKLSVSVLYS